MEFLELAKTFEKLSKTSKRLEKVLILRDFLKNKKETGLILDMISGNFQREINKKNLSISLKTCFSVISFLSKVNEREIEKRFNTVGDVGEIAEEFLKNKEQQALFTKKLTLDDVILALKEISQISGNQSQKKKKEILSNLFLKATKPQEYKFLARFIIDDLRIGASVGVLREVAINLYFPNIVDLHLICSECNYVNLNLKNCHKCGTKLETKQGLQKEIAKKKYEIVELKTSKKEKSLKEFNVEFDTNLFEYATRRDKETQILSTQNPRELYKFFQTIFEKKYNLINSFTKMLEELNKDFKNILKFDLNLGTPILSMLGTRAQTVEESFEMVGTPALLDYKYDGLRVQIHNNHGEVQLFSRNLDNLTKQFPEIVEFVKTNFSDLTFVIDSECVGYDFKTQKYLEFQTLSKRILSKNINEVEHITVCVKAFDILYLNNKTLIELPYCERRDTLNKLFLNRTIKQHLHFDIEKIKNILN